MQSKQELREVVTKLRLSMSDKDVEKYSKTIANGVIHTVNMKKFKRIHVYKSLRALNEVHTSYLVEQIKEKYPNIEVVQSPMQREITLPKGKFDCVIAPMVAFDDNCHRIGLGAGWYDKFLKKQPKAQKIGLAFWLQRIAEVPVEDHDVPLDKIVTEVLVYARSPASKSKK